MTIRRCGCLLLVTLAVVMSGVATPRADPKRGMTLMDLMEVARLIDPQLSTDGRLVVYQLNRADWKRDRRVGPLWLQPITGGAPTQLTFGDSGEFAARWSPDGKSILFVARRGDATDLQLYLLPIDGGEPRALT